MGSTRFSLKRSLLLSTFLAGSLFSSAVLAQQGGNNGDATSASSAPAATTATAKRQTSSTSASPTTKVVITDTNTNSRSSSSTSSLPLPTITGAAASSTTDPLTDLPDLTKTIVNTAIPDYPAPTIPPTQNAPFMNHSTLPDGTIFIAVGSVLAALGLAVLIWRSIMSWMLHRSVERASMAQHMAIDKANTFPPPPAPFYKDVDRDSSPSLPSAGQGKRRTNRGPIPSATPSQTNLFFSPTAAPAGGAPNQRHSTFLPSGFYASNAPPTANTQGSSISMTNLRPVSRGGISAPSPPDSPNLGPRRNFSTSSVNLNRPPSGRAPSAFLDDLLDDQQGQFLPGPGGHHYSQSNQGLGRY
ncbi:hypothetical protein B0T19DRAFT_156725 [Cercophora scortea]|uniref:Uncharacterized protein n=1 Tax=Cercophora scortea TaxID=314031 RepID=A0AAE0ILB1_9PEZI|nr:hypothetical protein B0T19DRAFT_156725 [Cercophora scortea]